MKLCVWVLLVTTLLGMEVNAAEPSSSKLATSKLQDIFNFYVIDSDLLTAGQVLPEHIAAINEEKIELVVNLAVASEERNGKEGFLLTNEGKH